MWTYTSPRNRLMYHCNCVICYTIVAEANTTIYLRTYVPTQICADLINLFIQSVIVVFFLGHFFCESESYS